MESNTNYNYEIHTCLFVILGAAVVPYAIIGNPYKSSPEPGTEYDYRWLYFKGENIF